MQLDKWKQAKSEATKAAEETKVAKAGEASAMGVIVQHYGDTMLISQQSVFRGWNMQFKSTCIPLWLLMHLRRVSTLLWIPFQNRLSPHDWML